MDKHTNILNRILQEAVNKEFLKIKNKNALGFFLNSYTALPYKIQWEEVDINSEDDSQEIMSINCFLYIDHEFSNPLEIANFFLNMDRHAKKYKGDIDIVDIRNEGDSGEWSTKLMLTLMISF